VRLTIMAINEKLAKRGSSARLGKRDEYFYFSGVRRRIDRTVNAHGLSFFAPGVAEFDRLRN
jgi:hypothetical protein